MNYLRLAMPVFAAIALSGCTSTPKAPVTETPEKVVILPGEQAPLADPGQKNFGGMIPSGPIDTAARNAAIRARMAEMNKIRTVHFNDLSMSDPFIYPDPETKTPLPADVCTRARIS